MLPGAVSSADDDFTYDCEQIEVVIGVGDEMPAGSVDLNADDVHAFYNAQEADRISLSMRFAAAPFEFANKQCARGRGATAASRSRAVACFGGRRARPAAATCADAPAPMTWRSLKGRRSAPLRNGRSRAAARAARGVH